MTPRPPAVDAWEQADRRLDLSTMKQQLASDVRLVSPLTDAFTFDGPDEVIGVFESAFEVLRDIEVHRVTGADRDWVLQDSRHRGGVSRACRGLICCFVSFWVDFPAKAYDN